MSEHTGKLGPSTVHHPDDQPHLLQEVMRTSQALLQIFTQQVGIPSSQLALLRLLAIAHPQALGVMEMARRMGVNAAAITRQVQDLEKDGLVARKSDPRDARRSSVFLTEGGLRTFHELHERGHAFEQALKANVTEDEIAVATTVLTRLRMALENLR